MKTIRTILPRIKQKLHYLPIVMIIFIGTLLSLFAYKVLVKWDDQRIRAEFERSAENRHAALEREIKGDLQVLLSLQALYTSSQDVKRSQFRDFVNPLLSGHSSIQALEWIPRVTSSERATYETRAKKDGFPNFQITERNTQGKMERAAQREEYFPVYYVEPYRLNEIALGFDLASNATRMESLALSRDTGEMVATARIKLVQETAGQFGFLVFAPIYRKGAPRDSIPERRYNLKGFALGVFRIGDIVERSLTYLKMEGIDIYLYDKYAPQDEGFLYATPSHKNKTASGQTSPEETELGTRLEYAKMLDLAGRRWEVRFTAPPDYISARRTWLPWVVLSSGLLFSGLLTGYLIINLKRTQRIERIVKERTKELREANETLANEISVRRRAEEDLQKAHHALDIRVKERTAELLNANEQLRQEIAERTRVEATLRESEKKYRQVVENAAEVIYTTDAKGNFTYGNPAGLKITGYSPEELQRLNYLDLVLPEHRQRVMNLYVEQFQQRQPTSYIEFPFFDKSGKVIWFAQNASLVIENGKVAGFHIIGRDITKRKRAEEALCASEDRYRMVFEGAGEGILVADIESMQFKHANPAICRMLGYTAEELTRLGVADIHPKEALDHVVDEFQAQARGDKVQSLEVPCLRKDGSVIYVDVTTAALVIDGRKCNVGFFTNVSERKRAEEALRSSEKKYRTLIENLPQKIFLKDKNSIYISCNENYAQDLKIKPDEIRAKTDLDFYPRELAEKYKIDDKRIMDAGRTEEIEEKYIQNGQEVWVNTIKTPVKDDKGNLIGILGIFWDITERKQVQEALREREERYRGILETMEEGYFEVDLQGRFTLFNEALRKMHGLSKEEMLGISYKKYMSKETAQKVFKVFNGAYMTGQPVKLTEWEIIKENGEKAFMEASIYLVKNLQGERIGFRGIERDITARKQMEKQLRDSEEHFRSLIESSSDVIIQIDSQGNIRYASPSAERVLGYKPEEHVGQNISQFIHPDDLKSTIAAFIQVLQNVGTTISIEHRIKHKDGSWLFFQTIGKALLDESGNLLVVSNSRDITERKNLESQLLQAQKLESIGQLAAGIAHEINTPTQYVGDNTRFFKDSFNDLLRLIGKYEQLPQAIKAGAPLDGVLQEIEGMVKEIDLTYLTDEIPKAVQQTLEGVERVRSIVQAMKEFSHPGTKEKTFINLNKAIQNTITVARNEWKYVAEMATDFDSSLPLVSCLPGELNQVILNMIINAAHAIADVVGDGSKGKGTITISTRHDGKWAEIRVSDTGTGIPENIRSRIFDPFFTTKKVGKGTGQGLTISHSVIVDKHGGTIHFETEVGKGTTFVIRLPIENLGS